MSETIRHRGPDDAGLTRMGSAGLAMRRLSIIDLESGQQPIFNEDRSIAVVLNGEIYNYESLRSARSRLPRAARLPTLKSLSGTLIRQCVDLRRTAETVFGQSADTIQDFELDLSEKNGKQSG